MCFFNLYPMSSFSVWPKKKKAPRDRNLLSGVNCLMSYLVFHTSLFVCFGVSIWIGVSGPAVRDTCLAATLLPLSSHTASTPRCNTMYILLQQPMCKTQCSTVLPSRPSSSLPPCVSSQALTAHNAVHPTPI